MISTLVIWCQTTIQRTALLFGFSISRTVELKRIEQILRSLYPTITVPMHRIGNSNDGGYLVPRNLGPIDAVFSPGVADEASFEEYFADIGIDCFLIDGSVDKPPFEHNNFHFKSIWLGSVENETTTTLEKWVLNSSSANSNNLVLQIDIEGAEYQSLLATPSKIITQFKLIVIELHDLRAITTRSGAQQVSSTLELLLKSHAIVASHVNNAYPPLKIKKFLIPEVLELTLCRRDLLETISDDGFTQTPEFSPNTPKRDWQSDWENQLVNGLGD